MTSQNRRGQNRNNGGVSNTNKTTSQNSGGAKSTIPKEKEFRYHLHDGSRDNGYTFKKITQAIILKIQTTFNGGRYIVTLLRSRT